MKVNYKLSQLTDTEKYKYDQDFLTICSAVPFKESQFDKNDLKDPYKSDLFKNWDASQIKNRPLYASFIFVFEKLLFLKEMWEVQVVYKK